MLYDTRNKLDCERLLAKVRKDIESGFGLVEYTRKNIRTGQQNNYLHLCIAALAVELGESTEYVKEQYFKRLCNRDIFVVIKNDPHMGDVEVLRSTKSLSTEEASMAIDRFRKWASGEGYYIPSPEDKSLLEQVEYEASRCRRYGL